MKKIVMIFIAAIIMTGCNNKTPTQTIVDAGIEHIQQATETIKQTTTLKQCQIASQTALSTIKKDLEMAGQFCETEKSSLKKDLIRWQTYLFGLCFCIGLWIFIRIKKGV